MSAQIIQLHSENADANISAQIVDGLRRPAGQKELPTMLLYDERGLRLYDDITTKAPEYYLFGAEEEILKNKADEIVQVMHHGETQVSADEVVLELGAGALRKTSHILLSLSKLVSDTSFRAPITYYALDLEEREIERTLGEISASEVGNFLKGKVNTKGLCGTYQDGLKFVLDGGLNFDNDSNSVLPSFRRLSSGDISPISSTGTSLFTDEDSSFGDSDSTPISTPDETQLPLHFLFLGSSLGNFSREGAVEFLRSLPLRAGSGDTLLIGMDHDNNKAVIEQAYNDPQNYTRAFIMNGLRVAGRALGNEAMFQEKNWEYVNRYNPERRQHEAFFKSKCDQRIEVSCQVHYQFLEDELVKIEQSYKFSDTDAFGLFSESNLRPIQRWTDSSQRYSLWLLERPTFVFPLLKQPTMTLSPFNAPNIEQWRLLWSAWDCITLRMIPPSMLYQKPIDLRHICLFYLGHIPTFLDIHLSRLLEEPNTEPQSFKPHSDVPEKDEEWPSLSSILQFQSRVRARLLKLYSDISSHRMAFTRKIARVLFMTFEHEAQHAETLLYMLLQRAGTGTLPPPGFAIPPWESLAVVWDAAPLPKTKTVTLGPAAVTLGHNDAELNDVDPVLANDVDVHEFGWDNEHGVRVVQVGKFSIDWRPVTNGEFLDFFSGKGQDLVRVPVSWIEEDGEMKV
ncbi:hypothetical protein C0992_004739 [Termitomyces sp. T32_za158]|nr:hypothetical protein C0992_004739 [Termitomyces sp. T32_za158]